MTPTPEELKAAVERLRGEIASWKEYHQDSGDKHFALDILAVCDAFMKADQERDQLRARVTALREARQKTLALLVNAISDTAAVAAEHDAAVRKKALLDAATLLSLNANAECRDECVRCSQTRFLCKELRRLAEEKP